MSTGTVTPSGYQQEIDANGDPISGALIYTYLAGTSTPVSTFTTVNVSGGSAVPNSNPIVADSAGRWVAFLTPGVSYKYLYCLPVTPIPSPSSPPSAYKTVDNITAVPSSTLALDVPGVLGETVIATNLLYLSDGSGGKTAGKWYLGASTNTYSSTTPELGFAVSGGDLNDVIFLRQGGQVTGLSGLSAGAAYYVGTAGLITATPATNARFVGQADSTTTLIASPNPPTGQSASENGVNDFRLTLTTSVPVTVTDVTGAVTVFCTPYVGNRIDLYNASGVATTYVSAQLSIAVPAGATLVYDVFCYANAGVPTLELLVWASDVARTTDLTRATTGVLTKVGDLTRRYLGTFGTTLVSGETEDSANRRLLWNYYHRVPRPLTAIDTTNSWTYTTTDYRQANGSVANQVQVIVGVREAVLDLALLHLSSGAVGEIFAAIGEDSVTTPVAGQLQNWREGDNNTITLSAKLTIYPPLGYHTYVWLEKGNTTATFFGDNGGIAQSGLMGMLSGG